MSIQDEAKFRWGLGSETDGAGDIDGIEDRINRDAVAILRDGIEIDRLAVDDDQVDFGVGDTQGFDQVFDCLAAFERERNFGEALAWRQKIVQFGIEAKPRSLTFIGRRHVLKITCPNISTFAEWVVIPFAFTEIGRHSADFPLGWESSEAELAAFISIFTALTDSLPVEIAIWNFMYDQETMAPFNSMGLITGDDR